MAVQLDGFFYWCNRCQLQADAIPALVPAPPCRGCGGAVYSVRIYRKAGSTGESAYVLGCMDGGLTPREAPTAPPEAKPKAR